MPGEQAQDPEIAVRLDDLHCSYQVKAQGQRSRFKPERFRRSYEVLALQGVSVDILEGEIFGVIGHNGAGKSTLLSAIGGFVAPGRGEVLVSDQPMKISVAWALNNQLSGHENIRLGLLGLGFSPDEVKTTLPDIVQFAELGSFIELPLSTYSTGMKQRIGFSIATHASPRILLMDEALAVGDTDFREKSIAKVEQLQREARTVIIASHNLQVVRAQCDRVMWLRDGRVEAIGEPEDIVPRYVAESKARRDNLKT